VIARAVGICAYVGFYSGLGRTRVFVGTTAVMAVTNLVADYLVIFGNLGFPRLGIQGAAIGALLAEIAACAFLTIDVLKQGYARRFGLFQLSLREALLGKPVLSLSLPLALERLVLHARWFLFFLIIEHIGENALAKANVIYSCYLLFLILIDGFSEAALTLVSNLIGQDQVERIFTVVRSTVFCAAVALAPFLLLILLRPETPLSLFTSDISLLQGSVNALRVVALAIVIAIPGEMMLSAVAGTGDTRGVLIIELLLSLCVLAFAFSAAMIFELPLETVWAAEVVGWLCCASCSYAWLMRRSWKEVG
jgi:MATE family multidrug resistance protein